MKHQYHYQNQISYSENDSVIILAENLDKPRAIAVYDDRVFVTEKDGYIRVIENNTST